MGKENATGMSRQERRQQRVQRRIDRREKSLTRWETRRESRRQRWVALRKKLGLQPERTYWGMSLERRELLEQPPWWRALKDFIFGPPPEPAAPNEEESNVLTYIREQQGRITAAEIVALTGSTLEEASALALRLIVRYEGDVVVTERGALVFEFDRLATTASAVEASLQWIRSRGGLVSVSDFARHEQLSAAAALSRLSNLARRFGGTAEHGEVSRFRFDVEATNAAESSPPNGLRNYTYVWERLERSPVILGGSLVQRRTIIGLNVLNLVISSGLIIYYAHGKNLIGQPWEPMLLGYVPLLYAALVFAIPLIRLLVRWVTDGGRLRRNARRVLLYGLFDRLEEGPSVNASDLEQALFGKRSLIRPRQMSREMDRLASDYEGQVHVEAGVTRHGYTYMFEQMHRELMESTHERLSVNLEDLRVGKLIYDSGGNQ